MIAVPEEGSWGEPSDEAPGVRGALSDPHPSRRVEKATTGQRPIAKESSGTLEIPDSQDDASQGQEAPALPRKRMPTDETPRGAFFGTGPDAASSSGTGSQSGSGVRALVDDTADGSSVEDPSEDGTGPVAAPPAAVKKPSPDESGPDFVAPDDAKKPVIVGSGSGGRRPVKVRRILVECALCGYHVAVPPELFGKTVHCPECRADMMFSESSLEPVKDEIIGRIALEHSERRALEHPVGGPIPSPETVLRAHRRNAIIVVTLVVVLVGALIAFALKVFSARG